MLETNLIGAVIMALLSHGPVILVALAGIGMAISHRDKLRDATIFAVLGFALVGTVAVIWPVLSVCLPSLWRDMPAASIRWIYGVLGFVFNLLYAGGLGLLLAALLKSRASS